MEASLWAIKKAQPDYKDVHLDVALTNVSVAYLQDTAEFRAGQVFPVLPVNKASDKYFKYRKEDFMRAAGEKRAPSTESAGSGWVLTTDSYTADLWSFHKDVDDHVRANADTPLDMDRDATEYVTRILLLTREKEWVLTYFKTGVWTGQADQTGVAAGPGANQFLQFDQANSDPISVIRKGRQAIKAGSGMTANTLVLEERVYDVLIEHPQIVDRIKYTREALAEDLDSAQLLARVFRVRRVVVLSAVEATGVEGSATFAFMAGKHAFLAYVAPRPGLLTPSAGYIFGWRMPGIPAGGQIAIDRIRAPLLKSDRVEGNMAWGMKVVAADLGAFFSSAIA